jgi:hypothetical protein
MCKRWEMGRVDIVSVPDGIEGLSRDDGVNLGQEFELGAATAGDSHRKSTEFAAGI